MPFLYDRGHRRGLPVIADGSRDRGGSNGSTVEQVDEEELEA